MRPRSEQPTKVLLGDDCLQIGAYTLVLGRVDLQRLMLACTSLHIPQDSCDRAFLKQMHDDYPSFEYLHLAVCATKYRSRDVHSKVPNADTNNCSPAVAHDEKRQHRPLVAKRYTARATHQRGGQAELESISSGRQTASTNR